MSKQSAFAIFKYHYNGEGYFPVIPFYVSLGSKQLKIRGLIDSGATISVFKDEVADQLEIDIESGKEIYLGGVGGRIKGYIHKLNVEIAGEKLLCPVVFSREYLVSFNLLGRQAFFYKFRIIFEESKNMLKLE